MRDVTRIHISSFLLVGASLVASASTYELDLSRGGFPGGVETANLNGALPEESAYKHGYVTTGWTVDRLDNRGYVALSPTYTGDDRGCENLLSLPEMEIEEDNLLCWEARSVYRHFPESYCVMAYPSDGGEAVKLAEVGAEDYFWKPRNVMLESLAGKKVKIAFVCTSTSGYMLALAGVRVAYNVDPTSETATSGATAENDPDFTRAFVVDKATGMWCTNCPEGEVAVENLRERFGSRLILLNTHVQDVLANTPYWDNLKYYSVPRMMLNRIRATEGGNAKKFADYYDLPTSFSIRIEAPVEISGRALKVKADVKVSEEIDNSEGRYRVGYVLTGNFHKPDNERYRQQNNCTQPSYGAYYFLPSVIPSALMYYDDVTLTSETAFTGIEGSLPNTMYPAEKYEVAFECEVPSSLASPEEARIVAIVIDTETGELMNACELDASAESAIRETVSPSSNLSLSVDSTGLVRTSILPGEEYCLEVFNSSGMRVCLKTGVGNGHDSLKITDAKGMIIVRLSTPRGTKAAKFVR